MTHKEYKKLHKHSTENCITFFIDDNRDYNRQSYDYNKVLYGGCHYANKDSFSLRLNYSPFPDSPALAVVIHSNFHKALAFGRIRN